MKRLLVIIIVLVIVFISMVIYKNKIVSKSRISVEEIKNIENYISKIYMWKEVTKESLPLFDDINNVDDLWLWEAVKRNLEEYESTYDEIQRKGSELFGERFKKEFPKEGSTGLVYNPENNKYISTEIEFDIYEDDFLLNNIIKEGDMYIVDIIEYIEDYSQEDSIILENEKGDKIASIDNNESEMKIREIVKENINSFAKKRLYIKQHDITLERVEKIE